MIFRLVADLEVSSNAKPGGSSLNLILSKRFDFYPWSNDTNLVFKRGPALIFSQLDNHLAKKFEGALKQLEYSPRKFNLLDIEETLKNG